MIRVMIFDQHLHQGKSICVHSTMWNNDLYFYASLTFCFFSVPILLTVIILYKHLHLDRIVSVASLFTSLTL